MDSAPLAASGSKYSHAAVIGGRDRDNLALWLIRQSRGDAPRFNSLLDGGDLASGIISRNAENLISTDNVFGVNFGSGTRAQRYTVLPSVV